MKGASNMNTLDKLQDALQDEMMLQSLYNKHMVDITNPEVRQLFTQMRDTKMQNITRLQQEIQQMMQAGKIG
ncbi:spore coat protein [Desulfotruncus arcticus]|nr:spore coat protein [Desulfotruncus arcticus]